MTFRTLIISLFLICCFHIQSKAGDIRDFEIEGISIGDSLLDFFSKKELVNGTRKNSYPTSDGKFVDINLNADWFDQYEGIQVTVKRNDKNFKVHSVDGGIFFKKNEKKACMKKMEQIVKDLSEVFSSYQFEQLKNNKHYADPSGKSFVYGSSVFPENGIISVYCYLWDESMGVSNYVAVSTKTDEFNDWLLALNN